MGFGWGSDQADGGQSAVGLSGREEPGQVEPGREEPGREEPGSREEPGQVEPGQEELGQVEPGQEELGSRDEPGREEPGGRERRSSSHSCPASVRREASVRVSSSNRWSPERPGTHPTPSLPVTAMPTTLGKPSRPRRPHASPCGKTPPPTHLWKPPNATTPATRRARGWEGGSAQAALLPLDADVEAGVLLDDLESDDLLPDDLLSDEVEELEESDDVVVDLLSDEVVVLEFEPRESLR
ncbi:hypothetical protein JCM9957A_37350 [Kineosporia succinea]